MPGKKNTDFQKTLLSLIETAMGGEDEETENHNKKRKGKGKVVPPSRPPPAKFVAVDASEPGYDEELHELTDRRQGLTPCFLCWHIGHRARDHQLPPKWPPKLQDRWNKNKDAYLFVDAASNLGFSIETIAGWLRVSTTDWDPGMPKLAALFAVAECYSLVFTNLGRWAEGTSPMNPPPPHLRRGKPMTKFIFGESVEDSLDDGSDDMMETEGEKNRDSSSVAPRASDPTSSSSSAQLRSAPPTTPSKPKGDKPNVLPKGCDLVSASDFKEAESRVTALAEDVNTLRGEICSVKQEVGSIKKVQESHFAQLMSKLDKMETGGGKQIVQPLPALPPSTSKEGVTSGGAGDTTLPLGDWELDTLAAKVKSLGGEDGLMRLLYGTKPDLIAALSHITDVYIVHRDMVAQGDDSSGWQVSMARVVEIDAKGCLGWGVGAPPEDAFKSGRKWRGEGAEGVVYRTVPYSSVFLDKHAAHLGAETVFRSLSQSSSSPRA